MPFGGAGGLHVCALADNLGMKQALVPIHAGVLSALGMVVAPHSRELSHTINTLLDGVDEAIVIRQLELLAVKGRKERTDEGIAAEDMKFCFSVDLRYKGQSYTLNVPWEGSRNSIESFHRLHQKRFGHQHQQPVELVNVRVKVSAPCLPINLPILPMAKQPPQLNTSAEVYGIEKKVAVYQREQLLHGQTLSGPVLIGEQVATTWVEKNWNVRVDRYGNLLLQRE